MCVRISPMPNQVHMPRSVSHSDMPCHLSVFPMFLLVLSHRINSSCRHVRRRHLSAESRYCDGDPFCSEFASASACEVWSWYEKFYETSCDMLRKPPIRAVHKSGTRLGLSLVQQTGVHRQRRGAYARLANVPASKTHSALVGIL